MGLFGVATIDTFIYKNIKYTIGRMWAGSRTEEYMMPHEIYKDVAAFAKADLPATINKIVKLYYANNGYAGITLQEYVDSMI